MKHYFFFFALFSFYLFFNSNQILPVAEDLSAVTGEASEKTKTSNGATAAGDEGYHHGIKRQYVSDSQAIREQDNSKMEKIAAKKQEWQHFNKLTINMAVSR